MYLSQRSIEVRELRAFETSIYNMTMTYYFCPYKGDIRDPIKGILKLYHPGCCLLQSCYPPRSPDNEWLTIWMGLPDVTG